MPPLEMEGDDALSRRQLVRHEAARPPWMPTDGCPVSLNSGRVGQEHWPGGFYIEVLVDGLTPAQPGASIALVSMFP